MGSLGRAVAHSGLGYLFFCRCWGCLKSTSEVSPSVLTGHFLPLQISSMMEGQQFSEDRGKFRKRNTLAEMGFHGVVTRADAVSPLGQILETPLRCLLCCTHVLSVCHSSVLGHIWGWKSLQLSSQQPCPVGRQSGLQLEQMAVRTIASRTDCSKSS